MIAAFLYEQWLCTHVGAGYGWQGHFKYTGDGRFKRFMRVHSARAISLYGSVQMLNSASAVPVLLRSLYSI